MSCIHYLIALFLFNLACVHAQTATATGVYFTGVAVTGGVRTTITINTGVSGVLESTLTLTASTTCMVTLSLYSMTNLQAYLPNGTSGGAIFSTYDGISLTATNNAVLTTPQLTTPAISTTIAALISGNVNAGVLELDTTTNTFTRIAIDSYNVASKTITVTLPSTGIYIFVSINQVVSYPYAATAAIFANANRTVQFGSDVAIQFDSQFSNTLTVVKASRTSKPYNLTLGVNLNVFLQITLGQIQPHDSVIQFTYTNAELLAAGLAATTAVAANLRFAYYSDANAQWVVPPGSHSVDTTNQIIYQSTTTFSEWGIYYATNAAGLLHSSGWISMFAILLPFFVKF